MQEFTDKVAVVTGAGSGIGRAMARRFAAAGARVVAADLDEVALAETAALLGDVPHLLHQVDVADAASVDRCADAAFEHFGQVDVLCNNAGVFVGGTLWERPPEDFEYVLGVNLHGILHGIRSFVPRMIAQDTEGHVVNTASVAGLFSTPFSGPYGISKFAAFAASLSLANDLAATGAKVKASVLCPGMVNTAIGGSERHRPEHLATAFTEDQQMVQTFLQDSIDRGMDPADVAELVFDAIVAERFLVLTDDRYEDYLTGQAEELARRELPSFREFY